MITYIVFATGFCIQIFKSHQINYTFIFEVDHNYKLNHHQLYKVALMMLAIWLFCLTGHIARVKFDVSAVG